jgi:hypothetical protein
LIAAGRRVIYVLHVCAPSHRGGHEQQNSRNKRNF